MKKQTSRRTFMQQSGALSAILATSSAPAVLAQDSPGDRIVVGVIGMGRGKGHLASYLKLKNVEVGYVCDLDPTRLGVGEKLVNGRQKQRKVKAVQEFQRILEDRDVNLISIAMPNFWHSPATILACQAGKHVYVEKPGSHNPWESKQMVEAARHHKRRVQMGNQRRSMPYYQEGIHRLKDRVIGEVKFSRCWYKNARPSIGKGKFGKPPEWLNWKAWQGPTPERPFKDNLVHYNWHWHWHYGGGELANNGIHALDICRWGLGVDYPDRVTCNGGRYTYEDDQETPDTMYATYHCGDRGANFESSSCHPRREEGLPFVSFYGTEGTMSFDGGGYAIYDLKGKEVERVKGSSDQTPHFQNIMDAIRNGTKLNSEIGDAQISSMWCHLGNIAYRTQHSLDIEPTTGRILNDADAMALWKREYRPGWDSKLAL